MDATHLQPKPRPPYLSPWLIILFTAPVPLLLFVFFFYKWYAARTDFSQVTSQFVQRQNQVMAHDAITVSREITRLLETMANDVQTAALLMPSRERLVKFAQSHTAVVVELDSEKSATRQNRIPLYNRVAYLRVDGTETLRVERGQAVTPLGPLAHCEGLCDRRSRSELGRMEVDEVRYGNLVRWYRPRETESRSGTEGLTVYYRDPKGVTELTLDYRHLKSVLFAPTFPYRAKTDLEEAYQNGNYIYLVDSRNDILVHPLYWHVTGIDPQTGRRVKAVKTDADAGAGRLNIAEYQGEKLKKYFERLISQSFVHRSVDIFRAPNLGGTNRVLSVAPVSLGRGQFQGSGIFGHVIIGCNVDYFEEPKEQVVPYY